MRKKILAFVFAVGLLMALAVPLFSGVALADESENSAIECGGTGLNPGQAFQLDTLVGGPAAGDNRTQDPTEFADLLGADSVGDLLQRDCVHP